MAVSNWNPAESTWEEEGVTGSMLGVTGIYWERQPVTGITVEATDIKLGVTGSD